MNNYYGLWINILEQQLKRLKNLDGFVSYKYAAFHFIKHELMDWGRVDYLWKMLAALFVHCWTFLFVVFFFFCLCIAFFLMFLISEC